MRLGRISSWVFAFLLVSHGAADEQSPGIRVELRDRAGNSIVRTKDTIALVTTSGLVDRQLMAGDITASWDGLLLIQSTGQYHFYSHANGVYSVRVGDQVVISNSILSEKPKWIESEPIDLQPGMVPVEVTHRATSANGQPQFRLFWSGPGFDLTEPIGGKFLYHRSRTGDGSGHGTGGTLAQSFRCNACHEYDGRTVLPAPALDKLSPANVHPAWLVAWLSGDNHAGRHCPSYDLTRDQATSVAAHLISQEDTFDPARLSTDKLDEGDKARGEVLFMSLGCLACHRVKSSSGQWLGSELPFDGGDLSLIAAKRPAAFFPRWLADPGQLNADHRMPVFELSANERMDLSAYLASLGHPSRERVFQNTQAQPSASQIIARSNCAACHRLPDHQAGPTTNISQWRSPCSAPRSPAEGQPSFAISDAAQAQLHAYIERTRETCAETATLRRSTATELIEQHNCLACHNRGPMKVSSIERTATDVIDAHAALAGEYAALIPPPLHQIGDKLTDEGLRGAIVRSSTQPLRPWLRIRMPSFRLTDEELQLIIEHFSAEDRLPWAANSEANRLVTEPSPESVSPRTGAPLVGRDGFNCVSCHGLGPYQPPNPPLNARGPNLLAVAGRVRPEWFVRWVRNPLRIVPNVEMPSIATPVPGALDERLDHQIAAVWHAIRAPQHTISKLQPFRVLRQTGADEQGRAIILTDVLRLRHQNEPPHTLIKPFAVGLANRHNVLLDLASGRLSGWWLGDLARQINEGKVWYWLADVHNLLAISDTVRPQESADVLLHPEIVLVANDGRIVPPAREGQFITRAEMWKHVEGAGVELRHRLTFVVDGQPPHQLEVRQIFHPLANRTGFARQVQIEVVQEGIPAAHVRFHSLPGRIGANRILTLVSPTTVKSPMNFEVRIVDQTHRFTDDSTVELPVVAGETVPLRLEYTTTLAAESAPTTGSITKRVTTEPTTLDVVPGFPAVRLPVDEPFMPTGLAWDPSGAMFVTSLDGRVWRVVDSDGDGLADAASLYSDELATPYGVVAGRDFVDVVDKTALLRLRDLDRDGQADETLTLASGWGHTDDYHDWAVGLEQDAESNYYIALPCQQDERSVAAAHLRGTVIQLKPHHNSFMSATHFSIHPLTGGHRFPHGIALNQDHHLFVTDNQGNFNPFNELNHVVPDRRYGFINRLEQKPGFQPRLTPPAINIPHPWTRSVNGICFLESPDRSSRGFGPFEGHVIGCEYDTRRLVRMTLQQVNGEFQGAVYPFSYDIPPQGPAMQGPIVCQVAPDGDLYIGSLRESGWGGGRNTGEIIRLSYRASELPCGIAEIRANSSGFRIRFTRDVNRPRATNVDHYHVMSYRRISTPKYGGDDVDRREEQVISVTMLGPREVQLRLADDLRPGFVYEFRIQPLSLGKFFPSEGHYTLNWIPAK